NASRNAITCTSHQPGARNLRTSGNGMVVSSSKLSARAETAQEAMVALEHVGEIERRRLAPAHRVHGPIAHERERLESTPDERQLAAHAVRVVVLVHGEALVRDRADAQLLAQLAHDRGLRRLPRFELAAGELPLEPERSPGRTLRHEQARAVPHDRG